MLWDRPERGSRPAGVSFPRESRARAPLGVGTPCTQMSSEISGEKKVITETCTKCGAEPRSGSNRWGKTCIAESVKRSREKRADEKQGGGADGGVDEHECSVPARGADTAPPPVLTKLDGLEAAGRFGRREGVHCGRCQYPAGEFEVPLDDGGRRMLGQDPRGWAPGHGDPEQACCRMFTCYDMVPGHRRWPV